MGKYAHYTQTEQSIKQAVNWLLSHQEKDGSWYGRWGICYIYGTWSAVKGMLAVGVPPSHPVIQKAAKWMLSIQHSDGAWGESCQSDRLKSYLPLNFGTVAQTAWATDTLISIYEQPTKELDSGIQYLLQDHLKLDWSWKYPTGSGLPGQFYIYYHSYPYIWTLLALAN